MKFNLPKINQEMKIKKLKTWEEMHGEEESNKDNLAEVNKIIEEETKR